MSMNTDTDVLARTLFGEAKANDTKSAISIAHVVMNRVGFRNWPDTVSEVCLQPWQFSCWNQNDPNRARIMAAARGENKWFSQCCEIAEMVIRGGGEKDPTNGATHYHTPAVNPAWSKGKTPCFRHAHLYYNNIDTKPPQTAADALQAARPLHKTRTVKGGQAATVGLLGGGLIMDIQDNLEPLIPYSEYLKYAFLAMALLGVGLMVWARISDRREGLR